MQYCSNLARNNEERMEEDKVFADLGVGTINITEEFFKDVENEKLIDEMARAFEEELYKETNYVKYLENQNEKLSNLVFKMVNDMAEISEKTKELNDKMDSIGL